MTDLHNPRTQFDKPLSKKLPVALCVVLRGPERLSLRRALPRKALPVLGLRPTTDGARSIQCGQ